MKTLDQWGGSTYEGACGQAWWPEFAPWNPHGGRDNLHLQVLLYVHMHVGATPPPNPPNKEM